MQNAGMAQSQGGIKTAGRSINNLRNSDDTILMSESEEEPPDEDQRVKNLA